MDYLTLGSTPSDESCAQVGSPNYTRDALSECRRFRDLLARAFPPPPGARFGVKSFPHDFGTYHEVVVLVDDQDSMGFALSVEEKLPSTWQELEHLAGKEPT